MVRVGLKDTSTSTGGTHLYGLRSNVDTAAIHGTNDKLLSVSGVAAKQTLVPSAAGQVAATFRYYLDSTLTTASATRVAGTYTFDYSVQVFSLGVAVTASASFGQFTIVVSDGTAAAAGAVSAAGTSTAVLKGGSTWAASGDSSSTDSTLSLVNTPTGTAVAVIRVTQKTSAGDPSRESITATINIGNLGSTSSSASGKSVTFVGDADGEQDIFIFGDGSAGVATITLKTTSVTFSSKQVTFYGTTVASYTIKQLATVIGSSEANTFVVTALDAQGVEIREASNTTVFAYSSDLNVIATATASTSGQPCSGYSATAGGHVCALTGAANGEATITIRNKSTTALSTVSKEAGKVTVNVNIPAKIELAFDKATYAPGEVAYLTVSATDAAGKPVAPSTGYANMLATGGITSNVAFGNGSASSDSMTATTLPFNTATSGKASTVGVYTVKVFMPASGGAIEAYVTGGTALPAANQVKITAKATVTDNGAAALAAVNALATTVASLRTLITTLTNLVLKIQKKVKA
jgi:hypothetical protein